MDKTQKRAITIAVGIVILLVTLYGALAMPQDICAPLRMVSEKSNWVAGEHVGVYIHYDSDITKISDLKVTLYKTTEPIVTLVRQDFKILDPNTLSYEYQIPLSLEDKDIYWQITGKDGSTQYINYFNIHVQDTDTVSNDILPSNWFYRIFDTNWKLFILIIVVSLLIIIFFIWIYRKFF